MYHSSLNNFLFLEMYVIFNVLLFKWHCNKCLCTCKFYSPAPILVSISKGFSTRLKNIFHNSLNMVSFFDPVYGLGWFHQVASVHCIVRKLENNRCISSLLIFPSRHQFLSWPHPEDDTVGIVLFPGNLLSK